MDRYKWMYEQQLTSLFVCIHAIIQAPPITPPFNYYRTRSPVLTFGKLSENCAVIGVIIPV